MATYTKEFLSDSTNGRMIKVAQTVTPGTAIHTAHATAKDELWLWVVNSSASAVKLTVELGGVTVPDDLVEFTVPAEDGFYLIVAGQPLSGSVLTKAFAATANVLMIAGFVNRIT